MNILQKWMAKATPQEKTKLANLAKVSRGSLQFMAGGYRSGGKVNIGPDAARRIEIASCKLERDGLPLLRREDLCLACARCEYAKNKK